MSTTDDVKVMLSKPAAIRFEANLFLEAHPEFFPCVTNRERMFAHMDRHKIPATLAGWERAHKELCEAGEILPRATAMALMSGSEIQELARKHGTEIVDEFGRHQGYDWPADWNDAPVSPSKLKRQGGGWNSTASLAPPTGAKGYGYRPSLAEFHSWTAEQTRYWLAENSFLELPDYLLGR